MGKTKLLAVLVAVLAVALVGCDKAKGLYLEGEQMRLAGQFDGAIVKYDEAMNVNPSSEFAAKAKVSKATALFSKGEKYEKDGKYPEAFDAFKKWVEMDPEKDLMRGPKAKIVYKAENAVNELIKGAETPDKRDTVRRLAELITTYDDSQFKKNFWAAYFAAEQKNVKLLRSYMEQAKKFMPAVPAVPYSTIWSLMELAVKLDDMAHPPAAAKKDEPAAKADAKKKTTPTKSTGKVSGKAPTKMKKVKK